MRYSLLAALVCSSLLDPAMTHASTKLTHRYEFNGNFNDSIDTLNAIGTAEGLSTAPVSFDAARPDDANGPLASVEVGKAEDATSGFTIPESAFSDVGSLSFWFRAHRIHAETGSDYILNWGGSFTRNFRVYINEATATVRAKIADTPDFALLKLSGDDWHHVVITWDQNQRSATVYFDGKKVNSRTWDDASHFKWQPMKVGSWAFTRSYMVNQFQGSIYDFQIYTGELEEADVKKLFATPGCALNTPQ